MTVPAAGGPAFDLEGRVTDQLFDLPAVQAGSDGLAIYSIRHCLFVAGMRKIFSMGAETSSIEIHPDQVLSAVEALEQIALQMPTIDGFLDHILLLLVPHRVVQHFLHTPIARSSLAPT